MRSRLMKKGQSGQSLVILAIGFLALLGFVGIVTDVSVLFIRYSTMRRAVDAAAIAAAGQMRRIQDTMLNPDGTGIADGQATSVANLNLAARQFIEVYGLNPKSVIVETCRTQQVARDANGEAEDAAGNPIMVTVTTIVSGVPTTKIEPNTGQVPGIPAADPETVARYRELCTDDELKLVRVTTQIDAPTIFLRLLGYPTVTLTETAISQTAVIDVVLIFDVSESMLNETTYEDWDNVPNSLTPKQGVRYMPPYVSFYDYGGWVRDPDLPDDQNSWNLINTSTQTQLNALIAPNVATLNPLIDDKIIAFEPMTANPGPTDWRIFVPGDTSNRLVPNDLGRIAPQEFCQVRAYPGTVLNGDAMPQALRNEYYAFFTNVYPFLAGNDPDNNFDYDAQWAPGADIVWDDPSYGNSRTTNDATNPNTFYNGFVPQYNYYGCCNDPDGDWSFRDLVCQPFKQARDAAHQFLNRLDFLRGDRVAFVTFDRRATVIDPDGETIIDPNLDGDTSDNITGGVQAHMIETQTDIYASDGVTRLRKGANDTLDDVIGVRGEISSYADVGIDGVTANGEWDHLRDHTNAVDVNYFMNTRIGDLFDHPVNNACPFTEAVIPPVFLTYERQRSDAFDPNVYRIDPLISTVITLPTWYDSLPLAPGVPNESAGRHDAQRMYRNYEYRASCAGTNIGEALQAGSGALYNEARREGAVWIMVLLSDGAAGASNPITKYQNASITPADPFEDSVGIIIPQKGVGGPAIPNANGAGGYGIFGLCPYGTQTQPSQLVANNNTDYFPACGDLDPASRHFCGTVSVSPNTALEQNVDCFNYYNVDDYARDWADWVGVAELKGSDTTGNTGRISNQLLPTIFAIGFGLNFDDGACGTAQNQATWDCQRGLADQSTMTIPQKKAQRDRTADFLGEELLRYIADVGDNNQIDSDYWQVCMSGGKGMNGSLSNCRDDGTLAAPLDPERIENFVDLTSSAPNWGQRGACQQTSTTGGPSAIWGRGSFLEPLAPRQPCGNYYVAATQQELEEVFNQIASRMFTRLSQ
jgi:hypothetical protein